MTRGDLDELQCHANYQVANVDHYVHFGLLPLHYFLSLLMKCLFRILDSMG